MEKIKTVSYLMLALVTLGFASCATQPSSTAANSGSPMERNKGNGLCFLHALGGFADYDHRAGAVADFIATPALPGDGRSSSPKDAHHLL